MLKEKGVDDSRWNLVTGNKKDIYYLARKSYLAVKQVNGRIIRHGAY